MHKTRKHIVVLVVSLLLVGIIGIKKYGQWDFSHTIGHIAGKKNIVPIAIIGGGPSGLSAGMYGARAGFHTMVFQGYEPGGQLTETSFIENWPGVQREMGPQVMDRVKNRPKALV